MLEVQHSMAFDYKVCITVSKLTAQTHTSDSDVDICSLPTVEACLDTMPGCNLDCCNCLLLPAGLCMCFVHCALQLCMCRRVLVFDQPAVYMCLCDVYDVLLICTVCTPTFFRVSLLVDLIQLTNCFPLQSVSHGALQITAVAMTARLAMQLERQLECVSTLHLQESRAVCTMVCSHNLKNNSTMIKIIYCICMT